MRLLGTKVKNLVGRPAGRHQGKKERSRRLKQIAAGTLWLENGVSQEAVIATRHMAYEHAIALEHATN